MKKRWTPSPEDLERLKQTLEGSQVPILPVEEAEAMLGCKPRLLGEGACGEAYVNSEEKLVVKFSFDYKSYCLALNEAIALTSLKEVAGVQRLVGVCLERALIVSLYAGPILNDLFHPDVLLLPEEWVDLFIKIVETFRAIHAQKYVHNDIKDNNICVRRTPGGFEVTVIDFGLTKPAGYILCLAGP